MDASAYDQITPVQILRDRSGPIIGCPEEHRSTGKIIARDACGSLMGTYDPRGGTARIARSPAVAHGDALAALLIRR
jgi:hypothetical protein